MIHGIDTSYLVAIAVQSHPLHRSAIDQIQRLIGGGDELAVASQVLAEFVHVVTDGRRFEEPLTMIEATTLALEIWNMREVRRVFTDGHAVSTFFAWLSRHQLGRKRLLDTQLAATCQSHGIVSVLTLNPTDFHLFEGMKTITPDTAL